MERSVLFGKVFLTAIVFAMFAGVAVGASERVSKDKRTFTVKLQIDKPYCILNFMETLRTRGYYGPTLYEHYKKSKYREDEEPATTWKDIGVFDLTPYPAGAADWQEYSEPWTPLTTMTAASIRIESTSHAVLNDRSDGVFQVVEAASFIGCTKA